MNLYPPGATFCRTCGYCLHGLPAPRCPECGHAFDPADPATFLSRPRRRWIKRTIFWTVFALLVLAVAYGGFLTWLYLGWKAEEPARGLARGPDDQVATKPFLPPQVSWLLVGACRRWQERIDTVHVFDRPLSAREIVSIATCRRLRVLRLDIVPLTADDIAQICRCRELEELWLYDVGLSPNAAVALVSLKSLKSLDLGCNETLDDSVLETVAQLKELERLELGPAAITDDGLRHLAALPKLQDLRLLYCDHLTEAAVPNLSRLKGLRLLGLLRRPPISEAAIEQLKKNLPQCYMLEKW